MNLDECLEKYQKITLNLIDKIKRGEVFENLINERFDVVKKIGDSNFSKEEIKKKLDASNIIELDEELQKIINQEKIKTKNKIDNLKKARILKKSYNNSRETLSFFSAKT